MAQNDARGKQASESHETMLNMVALRGGASKAPEPRQ